MKLSGRRFDTGEWIEMKIGRDRVLSMRSVADDVAVSEPPPSVPWISPGFVDLQVNGFGGQEFNDRALTGEKVARVGTNLDQFGVVKFCPTATTHSFEMLRHSLGVIGRAIDEIPDVARRVPGIHLEGPYIASEDGPRGAHPREHCRPPCWDEFRRLQDASLGHIRILTMSPEYDGSPDFIAKAVAENVIIAIGHTAADSDQIRAAVDAGARFSTHLGNGAHGQIRRHPNYIWDQLAEDRLWATLIVDGHHLPPSVVKSFIRAKSPERCILVSDLMGMGGLPPGRYDETSIGAVEILDDGRLVVAGQRQYLAGAALPISVGIPNAIQFAGIDLATAVRMASMRPAELIGIEPGHFEPGSKADFTLFDWTDTPNPSLRVRRTINAGEIVWSS